MAFCVRTFLSFVWNWTMVISWKKKHFQQFTQCAFIESVERHYIVSLVHSLQEVPPFFTLKRYFRIQKTHYCGGWSHLGLEHSISLSKVDVLHLYQLHSCINEFRSEFISRWETFDEPRPICVIVVAADVVAPLGAMPTATTRWLNCNLCRMGLVTTPTSGTVIKQTVRQKLKGLYQIVLFVPMDKLASHLHVSETNRRNVTDYDVTNDTSWCYYKLSPDYLSEGSRLMITSAIWYRQQDSFLLRSS